MTVVAIHQPQYLPWVPYFDKADRCDVLVYLDNVQFHRGGVQNRNQIKTAHGRHWLAVPVTGSLDTKIGDVRIVGHAWQKAHVSTIRQAYARAPHRDELEDGLQQLLEQPWELLVELNIAVTEWMLKKLDIQCRRVRASSLDVTGKKDDLVIAVTRALGGTVYVSGAGAGAYQDAEKFRRNGIELGYQHYTNQPYPQVHAKNGFTPDLSALDLILNTGPMAKDIMRAGRN